MTTLAPQSDAIIALTEAHAAHNYAPLPVVLARAEGVWAYDADGRVYLDCISAYSSLNQGHRHPRIINALIEQSARLTLASRAVYDDRLGTFLTKLTAVSGFDAVLPMNTGSEAVETAIKLARKWGEQVKGIAADRSRIIACRNNFHGRTTTIISMSTEAQYRQGFGPFTPGFDSIDFDDPAALEAAIQPDTAAFLVEPIQAEAGIITPTPGYLAQAQEICRAANVLLMLDEIQTGLGRTGRMFAYQHELGESPDVLILGKALGGGVYPVSAVLAKRELMDVFGPGDHGSTFGGNPLAAAVATAALAVIVDQDLPRRAAELGDRLTRAIDAIGSRRLKSIRGQGLLLGLEVDSRSGTARDLALELLHHGVLAKDTHRQVLRLAPPLIITRDEIDWLIDRLARVLS